MGLFTPNLKRENEIEFLINGIIDDRLVGCKKCSCLLLKNQAKVVNIYEDYVMLENNLPRYINYYCGKCKPKYDSVIDNTINGEDGGKKYFENNVEIKNVKI